MPFAELRVRVPDRPGVLASLAAAVATVGGDIVNVDVQHVHDGHAIDVLSIRLPASVELDTLTTAVTHAHKGLRVDGCTWAERDALTDPVVRALDTVHRVTSNRDISALERGLCRLLDATQCWLVPTPSTTSGLVAETATTGLPMTLRTSDVRCGPVGEASSLLVLPFPGAAPVRDAIAAVDGAEPVAAAIVARADGTFTDSEAARGMALVRVAGQFGLREFPGPRHLDAAPPVPVHRVRTHGGEVNLRPAVAEDRVAVLALHARCSDATLHKRFFGGMPVLTSRILDTLVGDSRHDNIALVVEDDHGRLRAVANLIATPDDTADAEIGLLVADDWQGQRIGTALLQRLQEAAVSRGWARLSVYTLGDNLPMLRLLHRIPDTDRSGPHHGVVRIEFPVSRSLIERTPGSLPQGTHSPSALRSVRGTSL